MSMPKELDYIGLSETSSSPSPMEVKISEKLPPSNSPSSSSSSSTLSKEEENNKTCLNLKETELRLGLPGSHSHSHSPAEKKQPAMSIFGKDTILNNGYSVIAPPPLVSGAKRGFSDAIDGSSAKWVFSGNNNNGSGVDLSSSKGAAFFNPGAETGNAQKCCVPEAAAAGVISQSPKQVQEVKEKKKNNQVSGGANENTCSAPAAKAQVVGWPPIRSFRKNSMACNLAKNNEEAEGKPGVGCVYVKVSMDGAPYLRKVDLKTYSNYVELSSALEKMFSCFTMGQCGCHGLPGRDGLSNSRLKDLLQGSEYVLTYEDKDGDWMLVGDVPWEMFTETCRRMRIMKGSEAIGLAPRTMENCKNHN